MKRALTLIELIFSMVIIAIAFTVFPKILEVSAKSAKTSLKEEGLYNAAALIGLIKSLPWDEQNTIYDDILLVDGGRSDYECNTSFGGDHIYRRGGFVGSRQCLHRVSATSIGAESGESLADDIDDFHGVNKEASNYNGSREFNLSVQVVYVDDPSSNVTSVDLNGSEATTSTNTKFISLVVHPKKKEAILGKSFGKLWYVSYNIGQLRINKMAWK